MADSVLALVLIVSFFAAMAIARWFKSLDADFGRAAATPMLAGAVAGALLAFIGHDEHRQAICAGIILTAAALYVRLTGRESEPSDGMLLGALTGATAAVPLIVLATDRDLRVFAAFTLAGAVAGYGITLALSHVSDKLKQFIADALTAAASVGVAMLPSYAARYGMSDRRIAVGVATGVPLLVIATVFKQWRDVRAELRHEASLGFIDERDVRRTAHPLLRLGRAGWTDANAHREFVRIANRIALRKRQQRGRPDEIARLYQLEIIKLRMQLQMITSVDRAARAERTREAESTSDTMQNLKA